jgi:putative ATPase
LTWEALRRVPEGGVFSIATTPQAAQDLQTQADTLPPLERPQIHYSPLQTIATALQDPDLKFDWILGRNALGEESEKTAIVQELTKIITITGQIVLAERIPAQGQRLYQWLPHIDKELADRWQTAEEAIYAPGTGDPLLNWQPADWQSLFQDQGFQISTTLESIAQNIYITPQLVDRWFTLNGSTLSYGDRLSPTLTPPELQEIRALITKQLLHQTLTWNSVIIHITAKPQNS